MRTPPEREVGVDFVREHQHPVALADFRELLEGLPIPEDAAGIVGIADHQDLGAGIEKPLQPLEIHPVAPVVEDHRIVHHLAAQTLGVKTELVIDRRLDDHLVAGLREGQESLADGRDHTRGIADPLPRNIPAMLLSFPGPDGLEEFFRRGGVAQDVTVQSLPKGLPDDWVRAEIHIRDPHREFTFPRSFILEAPGPGTVQHFVEIPAFGPIRFRTGRQKRGHGPYGQQRSSPRRRNPFQE